MVEEGLVLSAVSLMISVLFSYGLYIKASNQLEDLFKKQNKTLKELHNKISYTLYAARCEHLINHLESSVQYLTMNGKLNGNKIMQIKRLVTLCSNHVTKKAKQLSRICDVLDRMK